MSHYENSGKLPGDTESNAQSSAPVEPAIVTGIILVVERLAYLI